MAPAVEYPGEHPWRFELSLIVRHPSNPRVAEQWLAALVDTGATYSVVDRRYAESLGLTPFPIDAPLQLPGGGVIERPTMAFVHITIPGVIATTLGAYVIEIGRPFLLGMDPLRDLNMAYMSGPQGGVFGLFEQVAELQAQLPTLAALV